MSQRSKLRLSLAAPLALCTVLLAGCFRDMYDNSRYKPLAESDFFADGRVARLPVPGTVARGQLHEDALLYTGKENGKLTDRFPMKVDRALLARGRERFGIYCTPCHGIDGAGQGMIVRHGFPRPPSFMSDRLRQAPSGHFFDVITNGFGKMYDYSDRVPVPDRWAIAAYIRALQLSQHASPADVPPGTNLEAAP